MMKRIAEGASRIFLACGSTDFRKQIPGLVAMVTLNFKLDPYNDDYVFIFCNRKRDAIKVLRYDRNGFVLATKKLLDDMKFQWPRTPDEVKEITFQQTLPTIYRSYDSEYVGVGRKSGKNKRRR